ncbi:hypothetical protein [Bacillus weihaiensis]|uniref:DUF3221 domain-containing protein n=1 Tax=Bacillus weihaiensis TaxID=1547283 RepID=A0A1L3MMY0_9BACI|nr:hypothetical protein [Bacillus weihaiensis]APH03710.1 hypothetical protein A9C19_02455 [Bacillus weihaiensis]
MIKKISLVSSLICFLIIILSSNATSYFGNTTNKASSATVNSDRDEQDYIKIDTYTVESISTHTVMGVNKSNASLSFQPDKLDKPYLEEVNVGDTIKVYFSEGAGGLMIAKIEK